MTFAAGLAVAYLKILTLAVAIMAVVWALGKLSVYLHDRRNDSSGGDAPD